MFGISSHPQQRRCQYFHLFCSNFICFRVKVNSRAGMAGVGEDGVGVSSVISYGVEEWSLSSCLSACEEIDLKFGNSEKSSRLAVSVVAFPRGLAFDAFGFSLL